MQSLYRTTNKTKAMSLRKFIHLFMYLLSLISLLFEITNSNNFKFQIPKEDTPKEDSVKLIE